MAEKHNQICFEYHPADTDTVFPIESKIPELGITWNLTCISIDECSTFKLKCVLEMEPDKVPVATLHQARLKVQITYDQWSENRRRFGCDPLKSDSFDSGWKNINSSSESFENIFSSEARYEFEVKATLNFKKIDELNYKAKPEADITKMFGDEKYADFTFIVGKKKFKVHKIVLALASEVFDKLFTSEMNEREKHQCTVSNISPNVFGYLLRFIYGRGLPNKTVMKANAMELFEAAHFYGIKRLAEICSLESKTGLNKENALEYRKWATLYDLEELKMVASTIIERYELEPLEVEGKMEDEGSLLPGLKKRIRCDSSVHGDLQGKEDDSQDENDDGNVEKKRKVETSAKVVN